MTLEFCMEVDLIILYLDLTLNFDLSLDLNIDLGGQKFKIAINQSEFCIEVDLDIQKN